MTKGYALAFVLSLGFAAFYAVSRDLPSQYDFYFENEAYTATLQAQYESLVVEEQRLVERVDALERDPIEMEENIRHQKQLAKPGERLYRIEHGPAPSSQ
ncbi:MAG TPA: septum formation initiator family protein [Candidatus Hydrogenedentes bacterium]|nr:septum formation initiator family protein [Candidatus Hydrogenedentota bacterium]